MIADDITQSDAGCVGDEQIGKVFVVADRDVRKCLVCELLFTRRASAKHAKVLCYPVLFLRQTT